jgi:uncharacterized Tic20 family protein
MQPTNEERTLAALAHASIVLNTAGFIGLVAAAAIWVTQRERSAYVRGHAIQALWYQLITLLITAILALSWAMCLALSLLPMAVRPQVYETGGPPGMFWVVLAGMAFPILFGIAASLYALVGATQAYRVRTFYYPVIGRIAKSDLTPTPLPAAEVAGTLPETPVAVAATTKIDES